MQWCLSGDSLNSLSEGPSLCFIQTYLQTPTNLLFIFIFTFQIVRLYSLYTFDFIELKNKTLNFICRICSLLVCLTGLGVGLLLSPTGSVIISTFSHVFVWILLSIDIYIEGIKLQKWPSIFLYAYLSLNFLFQILLTGSLFSDDYHESVILLSAASVIFNGIILLTSVFKEMFGKSDESKDEMNRYSIEFLNNNPVRRSIQGEDNSWALGIKKFLGLAPHDTHDFRQLYARDQKRSSSWFGMASKDNNKDDLTALLKDEENDDLSDKYLQQNAMNPNDKYDKTKESTSFFKSNIPVAESAIERNIGSTSPYGSRNTSTVGKYSSLFSGIFHSNKTNERQLSDEELERLSFNNNGPSYSKDSLDPNSARNSFMSGYNPSDRSSSSVNAESFASNSSSTSRALLNVMDQHRAKIQAANPILEPRGIDNSNSFLSNRTKNIEPLYALDDGKDNKDFFQVTVPRWGLRSKKISTVTHDSPASKSQLADSDVIMPIHKSGSESEKTVTEVEFEIICHVRHGNESNHETDWASGKDINKTASKTVVWRTASEVLRLHGLVVSSLGDLAPKRPKLRSILPHTPGSTEDVTHAELISDMRTIAIFLNAILRNEQVSNLKPLLQFLELDKLSSSSRSTQKDTNEIPVSPNLSSKKDPLTISTDIGNLPSENSTPRLSQGNIKPGPTTKTNLNNSQSLMDAAELNASNLTDNQQEKWRKLFFQMRIKLKPHDIAVKCRLFEGVISGGEVAAWLIRSGDTSTTTISSNTEGTTSPVNSTSVATNAPKYQYARDCFEACSIGQELVACGLLLPVCVGFHEEEYHLSQEWSGLNQPQLRNAGSESLSSEDNLKFSDQPGFIYRFPIKSGTAGTWSLFGSKIVTKIPTMSFYDEHESIKPSRDTTGFIVQENGLLAENPQLNDKEGDMGGGLTNTGHVKYVIDISHGGDSWQTARRYREFELLHKSLVKEGIRPEAPFPSKSLVHAIAKATRLENRRIGLELYLSSAVQAIINEENDKSLNLLASFLDDDLHNLMIVNSSNLNPANLSS